MLTTKEFIITIENVGFVFDRKEKGQLLVDFTVSTYINAEENKCIYIYEYEDGTMHISGDFEDEVNYLDIMYLGNTIVKEEYIKNE